MTRITRCLHHLAISGPPQGDIGPIVGLLGQRLATKTANFEDPGTYHLRKATMRFAQLSGSCFLEALPESRVLSTRPDPPMIVLP
jgi:hypothetical protein